MPRAIGTDNTNAVNADNWRGVRFFVEAIMRQKRRYKTQGTRYNAQGTGTSTREKKDTRFKDC